MLKEPENMSIPIKEDYFYDGDVDEKWALNNYLGKDLDYAEKLYYTLSPLSVMSDFRLVGIRAFIYYIFGAFRYLQDDRSTGEQDVYAALPGMLEKRISEAPSEFMSIAHYLIKFSQWAIDHYEKFEIDEYSDIYGDVKSRYIALNKTAKTLASEQI